jgi:hypothetical protein
VSAAPNSELFQIRGMGQVALSRLRNEMKAETVE